MRKKLLFIIACCFLLTGCKTTIRFGTAGKGGVYYAFASLLASDINEVEDKYRLVVRETAGSAANIRLLSEGYIRAGISQADIANELYYADLTGGTPLRGYSAVTALYTEAIQVAVLDDSDITSFNDLEGKRISIGQDESGTARNAKQILSAYGLDGITTTYSYDYQDSLKHLKNGDIDAMFITAGAPASIYADEYGTIRILSMEQDKVERMINNYPYYREMIIPSGTYQGQTEDIHTVGIESILLASDQASSDSIYEMTRLYFENIEKYEGELAIDLIEEPSEAVKYVGIPFHNGAKKYYQSIGVLEEE